MPTRTFLPAPAQRLYRAAIGYRLLLGVAVPLAVGAIGYGIFAIWQKSPSAQAGVLVLLAGMLLAGVFLLYTLVAIFKTGFLVTADRLIELNMWPFSSKELQLKEIAGFRTDDKYTTIFPNQPGLPKLKIAQTTEAYQELQAWLRSQYPDLDVAEAEATKAALLADERLGGTAEERATRLALAKQVSTVLNIVGAGVTVWLFFKPQPYSYAIAAGLAVPLLAAGALLLFPGFMRLDAGKNNPHASVSTALLLPSFALLLRGLMDSEPLSYAPVWPVAGAVAGGLALLLVAVGRQSLFEYGTRRRGSGSEWTVLLICAALYGYGAVTTSNAAFDASAPTVYRPQVLDKHKTTGKSTTYYLLLIPWGARTVSQDVTVGRTFYEQHAAGDTVLVATRPGRLGIPWFEVAD